MLDNLKLQPIENWLKKNNWSFYDHQLETLKHSKNGFDILLVAPTGGGKTLAGFLPSLEDLIENKISNNKLHTGVKHTKNSQVLTHKKPKTVKV